MRKCILLLCVLAVVALGVAVPDVTAKVEVHPDAGQSRASPASWTERFEGWHPFEDFHPLRDFNPLRDFHPRSSIANFFTGLRDSVKPHKKGKMPPTAHQQYSYSSFTTSTPEGVASKIERKFVDINGVETKVIERVLNDKIVTDCIVTGKDGKEKSSHVVSTRHVKKDELEEFESEWKGLTEKNSAAPQKAAFPPATETI